MSQSTIKNIMMIHRHLNAKVNRELKDYHLHMSHFHLLHHIFLNEGITQNQLAEYMGLDKITVTKLTDKLVREGYIVKKSDREDKRYNSLYSTDKAKQHHQDFKRIIENENASFSEVLSDEDRRAFDEALEAVLMHFETSSK